MVAKVGFCVGVEFGPESCEALVDLVGGDFGSGLFYKVGEVAEAGAYLKDIVVGFDVGCRYDFLAFPFVEEEVLAEGALGFKAVLF